MVAATTPETVSKEIAKSLSVAWEFLTGETRMFDVLHAVGPEMPVFADFSMFMPMDVKAEGRTAGVGVLIQRDDASVAASHMFGLEGEHLSEDDLRDACAEVCNVFSGCIAPQVSNLEDVSIGLPVRISTEEFANIKKGSLLTLTYCEGDLVRKLFVLVYGVLLIPSLSHNQ